MSRLSPDLFSSDEDVLDEPQPKEHLPGGPKRKRRKKASKLDLRVKNKEKKRKLNYLQSLDRDSMSVGPPSDDEKRLECFSDSSADFDFCSGDREMQLERLYCVETNMPGPPDIIFGSEQENPHCSDSIISPKVVNVRQAEISQPQFSDSLFSPDTNPTPPNKFAGVMQAMAEYNQAERKSIHGGLLLLKTYLALALTSDWSVCVEYDTLSINQICHGRASVPVIERSIVWKEYRMQIYVRGKLVPRSHLIFDVPSPDCENIGSVADYLTRVSKILKAFRTCHGVRDYDHLWEESKGKGFTETYFSNVPCFRSSECMLIVRLDEKTCKFCRNQSSAFVRLHNRRERDAMLDKDTSKKNIRYSSKEALVKALHSKSKETTELKRKNRRLAQRLKKHIDKDSVEIDSGMSSDLKKICEENYINMSPLQKIFWEQQIVALSKRFSNTATTMKWHPVMIRIALKLRQVSPAAADILHEEGILTLPSQRRLYDYTQFVEAKQGCQQELLERFRGRMLLQCPAEEDRYFVLMMDEMHLRSNLVFSKRTGLLVGYVNLPEYLQELQDLQEDVEAGDQANIRKKLATKVLVYLVQGVTCEIQFIPAIYATANLSASELFNRTWEVIFFLERFGAQIICVVCDGASVNRKFIRMHANCSEEDFVYITKNVSFGARNRPLFFMLDPPHLWKTFRNSLANSYAHRMSRTLWKNGEDLSWQVLHVLYEVCKSKFCGLKLTKAHIKLTNFSCMKVHLATQIFSNSVVKALKEATDPRLKEFETNELCGFLSLMNRFIDMLNGGERSTKRTRNPDLNPYSDADDPRFDFLLNDFLGYFEDWKNDVDARDGNFSKQQRSRMMISQQTLEATYITVYSFVHMCKWLLSHNVSKISARVFNHDPIEQTFSLFRMKVGANNAPDLLQVLQYRIAMEAAGSAGISGSKRGNTEVTRRFAYDDSPLPKRKPTESRTIQALDLGI